MVRMIENDEIWIPTLNEVEYLKSQGSPDEQRYYSQFGWEQLEVPPDCDRVLDRMSTLKIRFDERYGGRMLGQETMERWQIRLQNKFDEVVYKWDRAYELYANNQQTMLVNIIDGRVVSNDTSSKIDSTDDTVNTSKNKVIDTPDTAINDNSDYADVVYHNDGRRKNTGSRNNRTTNNSKEEVMGNLIDKVNSTALKWMDIDTMFIKEFENNFLNIFYY